MSENGVIEKSIGFGPRKVRGPEQVESGGLFLSPILPGFRGDFWACSLTQEGRCF